MELAESATPTDAIEQFEEKVMGNEIEEVEPGRFRLTNNCFPGTDPLFLEVDGDTIRVFNKDNNEVFVVEELGALGSLLYGWHSIQTDHL